MPLRTMAGGAGVKAESLDGRKFANLDSRLRGNDTEEGLQTWIPAFAGMTKEGV
jgi:hypothetical protein